MVADTRSLIFVFLFFLIAHVILIASSEEVSFAQNYMVTWGGSHVAFLNNGKEVQLSMDKSSGAGFQSKNKYGSGMFHLRIKVPGRDSAGVVTAFYLTSLGNAHDELDFEFLGNREGKPYALQTNVFVDGKGNREQKIHLWFDPTANFHDYKILWNEHLIVFYVDDIPIRVYNNKRKIGVGYPSKPMQIQVSLWQADWATDGGKTKTNWNFAPFLAYFQGFDVSGCQAQSSNDRQCASNRYWWNGQKFWQLDSTQQRKYEMVKKKYLIYDYCTDRERYPKAPLECPQ